MGDYQEYIQSIIFGLLFSFLLAKLFSILFAFRGENLRITRSDAFEPESTAPDDPSDKAALIPSPDNGDDSDDSGWEGVESTELDEAFSAATAFVAATAADKHKVASDVQLQLYGLYKIANEGPCTSPPPSALKITARAKWQAWQKLGAMPTEEAMEKYLDIVTDLFPTWCTGSETKRKGDDNKGSTDSKGPMGPVFSTFSFEEESGTQLEMEPIHAFAREGDETNLLKCIGSGISVNVKDSEGRTPLHWAVDRGHKNVVELLISNNSDLNAKDGEGQTPLHYAAVCERAVIAELLVKQNADLHITDNDGNSPADLCEHSWPCLQDKQ